MDSPGEKMENALFLASWDLDERDVPKVNDDKKLVWEAMGRPFLSLIFTG
ncbi:hypothetical protein QET40_07710 [Akkermansia sp. N21169]|nr:hypothetical protein [Akkermansia sp. N21169]MDH3068993.1 hypothetical protein [Akkermansia sp. N21169]